jgi:hypothetical protein
MITNSNITRAFFAQRETRFKNKVAKVKHCSQRIKIIKLLTLSQNSFSNQTAFLNLGNKLRLSRNTQHSKNLTINLRNRQHHFFRNKTVCHG